MNHLDIAVLCILAWFVFSGVRKGLIISLASLVAFIIGIYAAIHFSFFLDSILMKTLNPSRTWLPVISFLTMFILVSLGVMLIGKALETVVDVTGMGLLNHLGGGLFGLLKGFVIVSALLYLISIADPQSRFIKKEVKEKSLFYSAIQPLLPRMVEKI